MEAPLSSPSLNGASRTQTQPTYFTSTSTTTTTTTATQAGPTSAPASQAHVQQPPHQQPPPQDTTSPFLRDFNLVAEAAKRAQMAVLMRDLEAVGIGS